MKFIVTAPTVNDLRNEFVMFCNRRADNLTVQIGWARGLKEKAIVTGQVEELRKVAAFWSDEVVIMPAEPTTRIKL